MCISNEDLITTSEKQIAFSLFRLFVKNGFFRGSPDQFSVYQIAHYQISLRDCLSIHTFSFDQWKVLMINIYSHMITNVQKLSSLSYVNIMIKYPNEPWFVNDSYKKYRLTLIRTLLLFRKVQEVYSRLNVTIFDHESLFQQTH